MQYILLGLNPSNFLEGFLSGSVGKKKKIWLLMARDVEDMGSILGSGRSPGGGNGNPFQYFYLENSMDGST